MSVVTVEGTTALEAWRAGCALLLEERGHVTNLLTTIVFPCEIRDEWLEQYSPSKIRTSADYARDVANTLFPQRTYTRTATREDFYHRYLQIHDRAHRWQRGRHAWGTYFERLIRFPSSGVNQLERVIQKLNNWPQRNRTGLVFHLSSPAVDAPRTRGGPCWQFAEILWNNDDTLDFVVVYRNHDFFNKVLGNFVGLGRLLDFICVASNKRSGRIICHSVHAYFDCTQQQLRSLINNA